MFLRVFWVFQDLYRVLHMHVGFDLYLQYRMVMAIQDNANPEPWVEPRCIHRQVSYLEPLEYIRQL